MTRLGIVGLGKWAGVLTRASRESGRVSITRAHSRSEATRKTFTQTFGIPASERFEDLLEDPAIDGIVLTVPNELHLGYALSCINAGKHVFIEKPVTHRLDEAIVLRQRLATSRVRVFVGHCAKLLAGVQVMRQMITAGELGEICMIAGSFANERALQLTPDDWRWYQDRAPGGPLSQIAIHQFDVLRHLGGPVESVSALSAHRSPTAAEVEDQWLINMKFSSGALGSITSSWTSPGIFDVCVTGTRGMLRYDIDQTRWGDAGRLHEGAALKLRRQGQSPAAAQTLEIPVSNMFADELDRFADLISGVPQPDFDAAYGAEILAMVEASRQSDLQNGVRISPASLLNGAG
jgi:predicted dehydrogenase